MTVTLDTTSLYSGKGFDVQNLVKQILDSQRGPETQWKSQQSTLQSQISAINQLETQVATLYTDANLLRDFSGVFGSKTASSSQTGIVIASATTAAETADHVLQVQSLASAGAAYSSAIAANATLDPGSLSITVGADTRTIDIGTTNQSLSEIVTAINSLKMGVTAKVQTDSSGNRLTLVSNSPGAAASLSVSGGTDQLSFTNVAGTDAVVNIDGIPYQSTSNTISGAIPGVTLNLASAAPNTDVNLSVSPDVSSVAEAISTFVADFNAIVSSINSQFTYSSSDDTAGVLAGDSALRQVQNSLLGLVSFSMSGNGSLNSLHSLGITMGDDGTLAMDSSTLNRVLTSNFTGLANFFQGAASFGESLGKTLTALNSPTTGALALDLKSMQQTNEDITNEINDFEDRLTARQQILLIQYSQINAQLQSLPSLQSQISAALDSMGAYSTGSSKK